MGWAHRCSWWAPPNLRLAKSNYLGFFSGLNDDSSYMVQNAVRIIPLPEQQAVFRFGKGTSFPH